MSFMYKTLFSLCYIGYVALVDNKSLKSYQRVVRLFFDILHGIDRTDIPLVIALEFAILLGYDGQLKQDSEMEKELFQRNITQLKETEMTKMENAMIWLYVKTWGFKVSM